MKLKHVFKIVLNIFNVFTKVIIFLLSLAVQINIFWVSLFSAYDYGIVVHIVTICLSAIPIVHIYNSSNNSSFKMSWIILILITPVLGSILYLLFGQGRSFSGHKAKRFKEYASSQLPTNDAIKSIRNLDDKKYVNLLHNCSYLPFYLDKEVMFLNDGEIWFNHLIEDIKNATKYVFLEYFVISDGYVLDTLSNILLQKADEGVEIRIILDDIGSKRKLKQKSIDRLNSHKNIHVYSFNPMGLFFSLNLNFRNHRKIAVIDGKVAYCGGTNLADEYVHKTNRFGYWRDNCCKYSGPAIKSFIYIFSIDWYMSTKIKLDIEQYIDPQTDSIVYNIEEDKNYICPFSDGPGDDLNPGYSLIKALIQNAKKSIYISTPYFIIDRDFITTLENAALSGIDVRILIPSIPDKKAIYAMTYYHIGRLIKSGVKVYRYTPGFNHAKNIIVDDKYSLCGTFNLDYRSLFLHFECGAFHINKKLTNELKNDFYYAINKSQLIDYNTWKKRPILIRIVEFIGSLIAPLL